MFTWNPTISLGDILAAVSFIAVGFTMYGKFKIMEFKINTIWSALERNIIIPEEHRAAFERGKK